MKNSVLARKFYPIKLFENLEIKSESELINYRIMIEYLFISFYSLEHHPINE